MFLQWCHSENQHNMLETANIIPQSKHHIISQNISANALKVLKRLQQAGQQAYLVGGSVRDLLVGLKPKDFDIATDASPEKVRQLFRNCRLIGRRFRLAHVYFGPEIIEVATFRAAGDNLEEQQRTEKGMLLRDNVYGTIQDDAWRRDFAINALYYNYADNSVVDFVGGITDLDKRIIRMIGDPEARYHEDPVRMLRALRLAAKLDFNLHPNTEKPIVELSGLLQNVPSARLFDEILKIFHCGKSRQAYELMRQHGLFSVLFPEVEASLAGPYQVQALDLIMQALANTDQRIQQDQSLNPAFLFAAMLWWPLNRLISHYQHEGKKIFPALNLAMSDVIKNQVKHIAIPKRFTTMMREIWFLQFQLPIRQGKRAYRSFYHPRFRAAYDFLVLRNQAGENLAELTQWWEQFQSVNSEERQKLVKQYEREKQALHRARLRK